LIVLDLALNLQFFDAKKNEKKREKYLLRKKNDRDLFDTLLTSFFSFRFPLGNAALSAFYPPNY
jgi:hypothetical protein